MSQSAPLTSATSTVWSNHVSVPDTPAGFTLRTTCPTNPNGVEVMLSNGKPAAPSRRTRIRATT